MPRIGRVLGANVPMQSAAPPANCRSPNCALHSRQPIHHHLCNAPIHRQLGDHIQSAVTGQPQLGPLCARAAHHAKSAARIPCAEVGCCSGGDCGQGTTSPSTGCSTEQMQLLSSYVAACCCAISSNGFQQAYSYSLSSCLLAVKLKVIPEACTLDISNGCRVVQAASLYVLLGPHAHCPTMLGPVGGVAATV